MKVKFKIQFIALVLMLYGKLYAQETPTSFGIEGGVSLCTISGDEFKSKSPRIGYRLGLTMDYGLKSIYMKTGIGLSSREYRTTGAIHEVTSTLYYIVVPIHIAYKNAISKSTRLVVHTGPYIAYGIMGKWKNIKGKTGTDVFSNNAFIKFDYGLGIAIAAEQKKVKLGLGANLGIPNINNRTFDKAKSQIYYLTLGYNFQ